jgi:RNA polymerase sigma factor (sigma-70 family)
VELPLVNPRPDVETENASEPGAETPAGKHRIVEDLFREHNRALIHFLRSRLGSDQDAREVAQEAYVRLLQLDRPEELSFLRAYLFKIAANLAIDHVRRQGRMTKISKELLVFDFPEPATQEARLEAQDELAIVRRAISELPPKCRQAFLLSKVENWSSSQIAKHMKVSDRMVRNYVSRALEFIQYRLVHN